MVQDPLHGEGLGDPDAKQEAATWLAGDSGPRVFRGPHAGLASVREFAMKRDKGKRTPK